MKKTIILLMASALTGLVACQNQSQSHSQIPSRSHSQKNGSTASAFQKQAKMTFRMGKPPENDKMKPEQTGRYKPVPPVVTPGKKNSDPPSDAVVLFNGKNLDNWVETNDTTKQAEWTVHDGVFTVKPGTGNIQTKQKFRDFQLHLEFKEPKEPNKKGQNRGNSGLFLASLGKGDAGYELQILNSYHSKTYTNGQAGSIYKQYAPLVNASRPPEKWQTYDVIWMAPRFNADSTLKRPATITAFQNGVLIQNHSILKGVTLYVGHPYYSFHKAAPIKLQDHHHKVSFRNIWIRPLK